MKSEEKKALEMQEECILDVDENGNVDCHRANNGGAKKAVIGNEPGEY